MKPVCVPCERFYRPKKNGFYFIEGMPTENGAKAGKAEPAKWQPYKVWAGDLWECPDCGAQIVSGVGLNPIAEQHHDDFASIANQLHAHRLLVKDC